MNGRRFTARAFAAVVGAAVVLGSFSGCGPGYDSSYYRYHRYYRPPSSVVVHRHIVEHHVYVHHR